MYREMHHRISCFLHSNNQEILACRKYLEEEIDVDQPERPVYLLGESFGAVLALAVAQAKPDLVDRLVLVNPATSYEKSIWPRIGPLLTQVPDVSPSDIWAEQASYTHCCQSIMEFRQGSSACDGNMRHASRWSIEPHNHA